MTTVDSTLPESAGVPRRLRILWRNYRSFSSGTHWFKRRMTMPGWFVLGGMFAAGLMGADTNASVAHQAFVFLAWLFLFAVFSSRFSVAPLVGARSLPRYGTVGTPLRYRLRIQNPTRKVQRGVGVLEDVADPRPTLVEFVTRPEPGEARRNWFDRRFLHYRWQWLTESNLRATGKETAVPDLAPDGHATLEMELLPRRRGVLRLPGFSVACPDPFGLFRRFIRFRVADSVLILPRRYPVRPLALPGSRQYQLGGVALATAVGESEEFIALRDYRPGDPLRKIHWKSWARVGRPVVKEYVDEHFVRHGLLLDTFTDEAHGGEFEAAVSVAASFACTVKDQDTLLDLMFVGLQAFCFTMGRGVGHVEQMLEILAGVQLCPGQPVAALERLVLRHAGELSGCLCVLLGWDVARQELVGKLRRLGIPVKVVVIVPPAGRPELAPGVMADAPGEFHVLETGRLEEGLAAL